MNLNARTYISARGPRQSRMTMRKIPEISSPHLCLFMSLAHMATCMLEQSTFSFKSELHPSDGEET